MSDKVPSIESIPVSSKRADAKLYSIIKGLPFGVDWHDMDEVPPLRSKSAAKGYEFGNSVPLLCLHMSGKISLGCASVKSGSSYTLWVGDVGCFAYISDNTVAADPVAKWAICPTAEEIVELMGYREDYIG